MTIVTVTQSTDGNIRFVNTYDTSNVTPQYISCIDAAESAIGSLWTSSSSITLALDFVGSDLGYTSGQSNPLAANTPSLLPVVNPVTYADLTSKLPSFDYPPSSDASSVRLPDIMVLMFSWQRILRLILVAFALCAGALFWFGIGFIALESGSRYAGLSALISFTCIGVLCVIIAYKLLGR
jgi:hypothetical protein